MPYGPLVNAYRSLGWSGVATKNGGPGTRVMYASIMMRLSPILKYQLAMDIQVISTLPGAAWAAVIQELASRTAIDAAIFLMLISSSLARGDARILQTALRGPT